MFKLKRKKEEKTLSVYADAVVGAVANTTFALSKSEPEPLSEMAQFRQNIESNTSCFASYYAQRQNLEILASIWEYFQVATDELSKVMGESLTPYMVETECVGNTDYYSQADKHYVLGWTSIGCNHDAIELSQMYPVYNSDSKKFKHHKWHIEAINNRSKMYKDIEADAHFRGFLKEYMNTTRFLYEMSVFKQTIVSRRMYLEENERA